MTFRVLLLFITLASLQGCSGKSNVQKEPPAEYAHVQTFTDNGTLSIRDKNSSYVLANDAISYRAIASPQGGWLAVETLLFSNLQIIRAYQRDTAGRYAALQKPIAIKIWADLSKKEAFSTEDVRYPRMHFLRWIDEHNMLINVSGEYNGKSIDHNITFLLR